MNGRILEALEYHYISDFPLWGRNLKDSGKLQTLSMSVNIRNLQRYIIKTQFPGPLPWAYKPKRNCVHLKHLEMHTV